MANRRLWENSGKAVARGMSSDVREEVVEGDLRLDDGGVGVREDAVRSDEGEMEGAPGGGHGAEGFEFGAEVVRGDLVDGVGAGGPLHFADVDDAVGAVEQEVDLGPVRVDGVGEVAPGGNMDEDAGNLEGLLDLGDMGEAYALEGEARPGVLGARTEGMGPEAFVAGAGGEKLAVEEDEGIEELPEGAFLGLSVRGVLADEAALFEFFETTGEDAVVGEAGTGEEGGTVGADADGGKGIDNPAVVFRMAEEGGEEGVVFGSQGGAFREEKGVEILGDGETLFEEAPVPGNAAEGHVGGADVAGGKDEAAGGGVVGALAEGERAEENLAGQAVVEAAAVADEVGYHPGRGGAADDEDQVLAERGAGVPEVFQFGEKARARGVQPREFVEEDDVASGAGLVEQAFEREEGIVPGGERGTVPEAVAEEGIAEMEQLVAERCGGHADVFKGKGFGEGLADEIGLADAAAAVDGDELGLFPLDGLQQEAAFGVAALALLVWKRREVFGDAWVAPCLMYAGILGNVIDRIWRGYVIDMFDLHWGANHFPCFNVADMCICAAAGLMVLESLRESRRKGA